MFEVKDIIKKLANKEPLTEQERFKILNSKRVKPEVLQYLSSKFENLTIEVCGDYEGNILDLMDQGELEGWCWQTTESAIVFLNDEDYIERGNLKFERYKSYYHSWICFTFKGEEYAFDPCLDLLCKKKWYSKIFELEVKAKVTAKEVRDNLIDCIQNPKPKEKSSYYSEEATKAAQEFMKQFFGSRAFERQKDETHISGNDDVHSPMYRNNTGYKATIEDGKIKTLIAHYYMNG